MSARLEGIVALACVIAALAGCGGSGDSSSVVLVTHDSFVMAPAVKRAFEDETGLRLRILKGGDAGEVVARALLTAGDPEGDVLFGVDNNRLARTLAGDVFEPYRSRALASVDDRWLLDPEHRVTPIDHGEVCLNVDRGWYAERRLRLPTSLADLAENRYAKQLVVENPATSTPGLAFLLATVARYGEPGWQRYWQRLRTNGVLVVDGWEEAYSERFSGSTGSRGTRPVVVSYASSPPAEVLFRTPRPARAPTGVVEDSCFQQVELAGVLRGAHNEEGAKEFVDFLLSDRFQESVPLGMFVFPVSRTAALPRVFARYAVVPRDPLTLPPGRIEANRERWVKAWTRIVLR